MIVSPHFRAEEFVPKYFWKKYGEKSVWWISPEIISMAEFIRERYEKPVKINDWVFGGKLEYRGFRPANSTIGTESSQHKLSKALDFTVKGMTAKVVYDDLVANWQEDWPFTTVEDIRDTYTLNLPDATDCPEKEELETDHDHPTFEILASESGWVHIDARNTRLRKLLIVRA